MNDAGRSMLSSDGTPDLGVAAESQVREAVTFVAGKVCDWWRTENDRRSLTSFVSGFAACGLRHLGWDPSDGAVALAIEEACRKVFGERLREQR